MDGKLEIEDKKLFVPHFTASLIQQDLLSQESKTEIPTELLYIKKSPNSKSQRNKMNGMSNYELVKELI